MKKTISRFIIIALICNLFISNARTADNYNYSSSNWLATTVTAGLLALGSYVAHKLYKVAKSEKFEEEYPKTKYYVETYAPPIAAIAAFGALLYTPIQLAKWNFMKKSDSEPISFGIGMLAAQMIPSYLMMSKLRGAGPLPEEHRSTVTLKDYAGTPDPAILKVIEYLKSPSIRKDYKENRLTPTKGILLYGPPGTGKTYLARAISGETNTPFFAVSAADINQSLIGQTEKVIKAIFDKAKKAAIFNETQTSIIFIDEIDSIAGKRSGKSDYHRSLLGTLLGEMDGIKPNNNVIVLACTNAPEDLDPAIKREGRFDQMIVLDLPNVAERKQLIKFYLSKVPYEHQENATEKEHFIDEMTRLTDKMAAATLKGIIDDAMRAAIHQKNELGSSKVIVTNALILETINQKIRKQRAIELQHATADVNVC